ncbi:hypothetical protein CMV30_02150 [Nibricoccus aquaticus]|uniref:Uncharacterized protein n=1 Tax=Nibricoccus aquaticus TaxID=2576891 RepID=A0A290Q2H9_9BACT|nr:SIR2 family protein [Nibricoccus aquaticus]ATC62859.1 hypothetical protein CMV30_02150 [Nibricoccus aquaticus]
MSTDCAPDAKKKLLVILGAGSSIEQGFPSVDDLDRDLREQAKTYVSSRGGPDFFQVLWDNRERYGLELTDETRPLLEWRTRPTFERVLGDLHLLMNATLGSPHGDPMYSRLLSSFDLKEPTSNKLFYQTQGQLSALLSRVAFRVRGTSKIFEFERRARTEFKTYSSLFAALARTFDVGIYNLNYDTAALNALPNSFVGFDRHGGAFLPAKVIGRREWSFIYHLHGSVHHRIIRPVKDTEHIDFGPKIIWYDDLWQSRDTVDWDDTDFISTRSDQKRMVVASLVAGGWKLDQLQSDPFLTFYSQLARHAYEADAVLIAGYGFGDSHIDSILSNMLRSRGSRGAWPPVMILDWDKKRQPVAKRSDPWATTMAITMRTSPQRFRSKENVGQKHWLNLPDVLPSESFEQYTDSARPVALYTGGFLAAATHADAITDWLTGDFGAL